jgi:hypothetical protein
VIFKSVAQSDRKLIPHRLIYLNTWKTTMTKFSPLPLFYLFRILRPYGFSDTAQHWTETLFPLLSEQARAAGGSEGFARAPCVNFWLIIRSLCHQHRKYQMIQAIQQYIDTFIYRYLLPVHTSKCQMLRGLARLLTKRKRKYSLLVRDPSLCQTEFNKWPTLLYISTCDYRVLRLNKH